MSKQKILITVVGPTAIGKTSLSISLANYFKTEIISCDSRQFYKEMRIGTAVPSSEELKCVPHHFIQSRSIHEEYNVGQFEKDAIDLLNLLFLKNDIVIMVGGSGLYVDAVLKGLDDFPDVDKNIRKKLVDELEQKGLDYLQNQLKKLDIDSYNTIAIDNPQRVIRALEICLGTGKPYSYFKKYANKKRNFSSLLIGLTGDREEVYQRINLRVDNMFNEGLLKEAKELYKFKNLNALQTVGYRELFDFFDGNSSLETAIEEIKKNTRRFAKRQSTWFRRYTDISWFDYRTNHDEIIKFISNKL